MTDSADTGLVPASDGPQTGRSRAVADPAAIASLNTQMFDHMWRVAAAMAACSVVPESLRTSGSGDRKVPLDETVVRANCFLVVNQATRWGMDPFAVMQHVAVVHGKLVYEGKLVAGVLQAKLGIDLTYAYDGDPSRETFSVTVSDTRGRTVTGTVAQWRTSGNNSPWGKPADWRRQLAYRGAREWARMHEPAVMLGVYSRDEIDEPVEAVHVAPPPARQRRLVSPDPAPPSAPAAASPARPARQARPQGRQDSQPGTEPEAMAQSPKQPSKQAPDDAPGHVARQESDFPGDAGPAPPPFDPAAFAQALRQPNGPNPGGLLRAALWHEGALIEDDARMRAALEEVSQVMDSPDVRSSVAEALVLAARCHEAHGIDDVLSEAEGQPWFKGLPLADRTATRRIFAGLRATLTGEVRDAAAA
jgi:hypothetical protein